MQEFGDYVRHGWRLCAISAGSKGPRYPHWNTKPIDDPEVAATFDRMGLLHTLSGTCAIDLDNLTKARAWLAERGVDIDALLKASNAVRIDSGRPGRAKLLYRLTRPLRTIKPTDSGLELRCATRAGKSMQDVLPPSIHPDTKRPYQWLYGDALIGDWHNLPPLPATLLAAWRGALATEEPSPEPAEPSVPESDILQRLQQIIAKKSADCGHDEWLKIGMMLHHESHGSAEGLQIWNAWSATAKSTATNGEPKYPGFAHLKMRWLSFSSEPGKPVVTAGSLLAEEVAGRDEFEDVPDTPTGPTLADQDKAKRNSARQIAFSALEKRLIYVVEVERYFDTRRHKLVRSDAAIQHQFTSTMPLRKTGRMDPVKVLKESATKTIVDGLGFHPGEGLIFNYDGESYANTYRPYVPEPLQPTHEEYELIEWLFYRIDDEIFRTYLLKFFAYLVQRPGIKIKSAPLIWSETTGNGKTTLLRTVPALLVNHRYSREIGYNLLEGNFTDFLANSWHLNLTEFRAGTKTERMAIGQKLKPWITDDTISVHPKGLPSYDMPNRLFLTATSNEPDAAPIDSNDRRWAVHEMLAPQMTVDEAERLHKQLLHSPRAAAVLRWYFTHDISIDGFYPDAAAPATEARNDMVEASLSSDREAIRHGFEQREPPFDRDVIQVKDIQNYVRQNTRGGFQPSEHMVGRILQQAPYYGKKRRLFYQSKAYRLWIIRNHAQWIDTAPNHVIEELENSNVSLQNA